MHAKCTIPRQKILNIFWGGPPDPSPLGGGHPFPKPNPLGACGASILAHSRRSRSTWPPNESPGSASVTRRLQMVLNAAVRLVVGAGKTDTPEPIREDTGRQAQQSCIQYAVAPAANGDHALHDRVSSLRI